MTARTVLTHCFAGKDRTGFSVAVVLDAAGVDRDTVMADYLHSNAAVPQLRAQIMEMIRSRFDDGIPAEAAEFTEARLSDDVLGVRAEYLDAALDTVAAGLRLGGGVSARRRGHRRGDRQAADRPARVISARWVALIATGRAEIANTRRRGRRRPR